MSEPLIAGEAAAAPVVAADVVPDDDAPETPVAADTAPARPQ